jgi:hypothetical protein
VRAVELRVLAVREVAVREVAVREVAVRLLAVRMVAVLTTVRAAGCWGFSSRMTACSGRPVHPAARSWPGAYRG